MSDPSGVKTTEQATAQEIADVVAELEQYRERLANDLLAMAQRANIPRATVLAQLEYHPEIAKVDAILQHLYAQPAAWERPLADK